MSKQRSYPYRVHARPECGRDTWREYTDGWKVNEVFATSSTDALERVRAAILADVGWSTLRHPTPVARVQVFGAGDCGRMIFDGEPNAIPVFPAAWSGTLAEFRALDGSALARARGEVQA